MLVIIGNEWWQRPYRLGEAFVETQPVEWVQGELDRLGVKYSRFANRWDLVDLLKKEYDVIVAGMKVEQDEARARGELKRLSEVPNPNKPKHRKTENPAVAGDMKLIRGRIRNLDESGQPGKLTIQASDGAQLDLVKDEVCWRIERWDMSGTPIITPSDPTARKTLYPIITEWMNRHART